MVASASGSLAWVRSLLLLERAEASGALELRAHGRTARIQLERGRVTVFEGELGPRLGGLIGVTDGPVERSSALWGASALAEGRVSRGDLAWALRRQLRLRARELARWGDVEIAWEEGLSSPRPFTDPMTLADFIAEVLRAYAERAPTRESAKAVAVTSAIGRSWAARAALYPHEIAAARGIIAAPDAARFNATLRAAGLADAPVEVEVRALARLHAQFRRRGAGSILGERSDAQARRRALRRVAGVIHPDRFTSDPQLGKASEELLVALSRA